MYLFIFICISLTHYLFSPSKKCDHRPSLHPENRGIKFWLLNKIKYQSEFRSVNIFVKLQQCCFIKKKCILSTGVEEAGLRTTKAFDIVVEWNADFNADFRIENFLYKVNQY